MGWAVIPPDITQGQVFAGRLDFFICSPQPASPTAPRWAGKLVPDTYVKKSSKKGFFFGLHLIFLSVQGLNVIATLIPSCEL
jgi:hypothetical protein